MGMADRRQEILPAERSQHVGDAGHEDRGQQQRRAGVAHLGPDAGHVGVAEEEPQQSQREQEYQDRADA